MARVGGKRPTAPGVKNKAGLTNLEAKLLDAGLAKTPAEAKRLAAKLTAGLKKMGLLGKTPAQVLKQFQEKNGLKQTGTLDGPTQKALAEQGLLPKSAGPPGSAQDTKRAEGGKAGSTHPGPAGEGARADGANKGGGAGKSGAKDKAAGGKKAADTSRMEKPSGGQKFGRFTEQSTARPQNVSAPPPGKEAPTPLGHRGVEVHQTQARAELAGPQHDGKQMQSLMSQLQGRGFGEGQPTTARGIREALRAFQREHQLPTSGKMDDATKAAMQSEGMLNPDGTPAEAQAKGEVVVTVQAESEGHAAHEGKDAGHETGAAPSGQSPGEAADAEAKPQVIYGMGEMDVGYDDESGNAHSGDEDEDNEDRGHASIDDGEEHEEGHYRVPRLVVQIHAALDAIERDDDLTGAPTYAWDVTFYRPGVYGRRQKATPLWHIGISQTGPFDPVWEQAHDALAQKLAEIEPESDPVNIYAFRMALRRARVRGQENEKSSSTYAGGGKLRG